MGYTTAENALKTLIIAIDGYSADNVSISDYRILAKGITKAVVLEPASFDRGRKSTEYYSTLWRININLFVPFGGEMSTVAANIRTYRQELIDQLDKYPTLNGASNITISLLAGGGEPEIWNSNRQYIWRQVLVYEARETLIKTYSE